MRVTNYNHVIFLHIYKTAGSSFGDILAHSEKGIGGNTRLIKSPSEKDAITDMDRAELSGLVYVYGHHVQNLDSCLPGITKYVTMLRDPVDRFLSDYYFRKHHPLLDGADSINVRDRTLEQWVDSEPQFNNQIEWLTKNWPGFNEDDDKLEFVSKNLETRFSFIGITEFFTQSVILCCAIFGWNKIRPSVLLNPSPRRPKTSSVPKRLIRKIEKIVEPDLELYDILRNRFKRLLSDVDIDETVWEFEKLAISQQYDPEFTLNQRVARELRRQELMSHELNATSRLLEVQNQRIERLQLEKTELLRKIITS
tara:strand:- start:77 stop:1006 length:930 start_codon:yes stop_codon:yes gene_type:complete